ncbi:hypothetical protein MPTK1_4g20370 [Marchantia polymorpha subsp. ruderalis]|uniref:Uncharacterized protein n=2 Tax=Marchantia polymorpha TaxID=3197 RepID=A0AAF6BBY3_MARPO|nr:hypothetical protein MARPO_0116s0038 [Marchantia polymorpha]BBN09517.1 hypothetical protein Mp_4g20370 [Marchantia polymorpha subsp. ruderalis]|eukprot:PTQ31052.1 hypothetical protein MARPO_0116s0038 [Marchantia polymorpha]
MCPNSRTTNTRTGQSDLHSVQTESTCGRAIPCSLGCRNQHGMQFRVYFLVHPSILVQDARCPVPSFREFLMMVVDSLSNYSSPSDHAPSHLRSRFPPSHWRAQTRLCPINRSNIIDKS